MMELQTDIFDGKVKAENIKFPGSQPKEGSDLRYEDANDNFIFKAPDFIKELA